MKRLFDLVLATVAFVLLFIPLVIIGLMVQLTSVGPILYWSERVGKDNVNFHMPKFRTMRQDTPTVATHLLTNPDDYLTPIGHFLRRTSLDELPQLFSILTGKMSFVGPRPALFNQDDLIQLRNQHGVQVLTPGLTGLSQISGRDHLSIPDKVALDAEYLHCNFFLLDLKILFTTLLRVVFRDGISH